MASHVTASACDPGPPATTAVDEPVVLCVDDDPVILELLFEILSGSGFRVICECDARRAARMILATPIDAAILDYDMPGYNGLELAEIIRRARPQVPVLIFSGTILPDENMQSIQHFVCKNQGVATLIEALRASCSDRTT